MNKVSQAQIIIEFFKNNPNREIKHPEIVDWATKEYQKRTNKIFRDPDRYIRQFHQQGLLTKVSKGIYKYDPNLIINKKLKDFSILQKQQILNRDNYRCVICGLGEKDGVELHVDHIKPKDRGGGSSNTKWTDSLCNP